MAARKNPTQAGPDLPGYQWIRPLGAGGFADVHLYHQLTPARDVAVKIVREVNNIHGDHALAREANAMAAVSGNPAIVALHSVGHTSDGRAYLVMEYLPVADVPDQVRTQPMAVARALEVMIPICGGVEMLHRAGLVHRDIKPSNIMLSAYGRPVLGDFGVSLEMGASAAGTDGFSVLWAPPEQQTAGTRAHPTQDVWALASTMWTLLAGRSPFEDPMGDNSPVAIAARVQAGRMPGLGRADAPAELEAVLRRAMNVDPGQRTAGAGQLGTELQQVQSLMRLPETRMDIHEDGAGSGPGASIDDDRTRVRAIPLIDGDATRARPREIDTGDGAVGAEAHVSAWTGPGTVSPPQEAPGHGEDASRSGGPGELAPDEEPGDDEAPAPRDGRRIHPAVLIVLAALLVVGAVGLTAALLTGQGGLQLNTIPTHTQAPADPIGRAPAAVTDLAGTVIDGRVHWSWRHDTEPGAERFFYTVSREGLDPVSGDTSVSKVEVAVGSGKTCVDVTAQGSDGRQSPPTSLCIDAP